MSVNIFCSQLSSYLCILCNTQWSRFVTIVECFIKALHILLKFLSCRELAINVQLFL